MITLINNVRRYLVLLKKRYDSRDREVIVHREHMTLPLSIVLISLMWILLVVVGYFVLDYFSSGSYLSGWLLFAASAILLLIGLSAPHSIVISRRNIFLHGYIDVIQIPLGKIKAIDIIPLERYRNYFPILFSFGFLGVYGLYYSFRKKRFYRIYTTRETNLVLIETLNEHFIINVRNPEEFVRIFKSVCRKKK